MSALLRWGFDRKAGAKKRPVPLVRSVGQILRGIAYQREIKRFEAVIAACDRVIAGNANADDRQVMADFMADREAKEEAGPRIKSGVTEEVEGCRAKAGGEAQGGRACEPCVEPVSRPAAGRSAAATSEIMDVTAGETAPELKRAEAMPPMPASAPVVVDDAPRPVPPSARAPLAADRPNEPDRAVMVRKAPAPVDWARVANAVRLRAPVLPKAKPTPTIVALSREACVRCGVPGWRGCDHQLPYEEAQ